MHGNAQGFTTGKDAPARPAVTRVANFLAWLAGVDPRRLALHSSSAQFVIKAIGTTMLLLSGPIAAAAMGSYVWLNTPDFSLTVRVPLSIFGALTWATIALVGVDRTLLIAADAVGIDQYWLPKLTFLMRAALAGLMASLFSGMLVEAQFSGIAAETSAHLALDVSESDAERLGRLNGLPQIQTVATNLGNKANDLERQYNTLPPEIVAALKSASRCDRQAKEFADALNGLDAASDEAVRLRDTLTYKREACRQLWATAVHQRDAYRTNIANQIAANETARKSADENLKNVSAKTDGQRADFYAKTRDGFASASGRSVGFEEAKKLHPEIARSAQLWWWSFFVAELMPVLLKTLLFPNNPVTAQSRADLAEAAGRHRVRARRAALVEGRMSALLARPEIGAAIDDALIPNLLASEHLAAFGPLADQIGAEGRRAEDLAEAYPDQAARIYEAYAAAVANALNELRGQYASGPAE
jgi:hypothetical protein